jgi:hypothetical protein
MRKKDLIAEVSRLQKAAGIRPKGVNLEEDDYDMGTPSGDTDAMNIAEDDTVSGEEVRMKNYLRRGSRDQINLHPNPFTVAGSQKGTIEGKGPLDTSNHPENKNSSQRYNNGYPWSWDQANLFEDGDMRKYLIGREFQTLDDLRKMAIRLRSAGYADSDINDFILNYIA